MYEFVAMTSHNGQLYAITGDGTLYLIKVALDDVSFHNLGRIR